MKHPQNHTFFAKASGKRGEIYIYEQIGESYFGDGLGAKTFSDAIKEMGKVDGVDIYINSPGGSVFDGVAIYNQIRRIPGDKAVHIDGIAASIASVIAMAGDTVEIAENGMFMIHDPWGMSVGGADEMRKYADSLDKIRDVILTTYVSKTGGDEAEISAWMKAETWMDAKEAVDRGFATSVSKNSAIKAEFEMLDKFKNVPKDLQQRASRDVKSLLARMDVRTAKRGASAAAK